MRGLARRAAGAVDSLCSSSVRAVTSACRRSRCSRSSASCSPARRRSCPARERPPRRLRQLTRLLGGRLLGERGARLELVPRLRRRTLDPPTRRSRSCATPAAPARPPWPPRQRSSSAALAAAARPTPRRALGRGEPRGQLLADALSVGARPREPLFERGREPRSPGARRRLLLDARRQRAGLVALAVAVDAQRGGLAGEPFALLTRSLTPSTPPRCSSAYCPRAGQLACQLGDLRFGPREARVLFRAPRWISTLRRAARTVLRTALKWLRPRARRSAATQLDDAALGSP